MSIAISAKITDAAGAVSTAFASASLNTTSITIGETAITPVADGGNGNLLIAQKAALTQTGTLQSLSFYVTNPAGKLRLAVYDASGAVGGPGKKIAETAEITPVAGWNTANVTAPVVLAAANYWLAYLPSDNNLGFRNSQTGSAKLVNFSYGVMPAVFPASAAGTFHFSFYATLQISGAPPLQQFTVTLGTSAISGTSDGTTSGAGTFPANSIVTVTTTPATDLGFVNWSDASGNVLSTSQSYTFTLVQNMNLVANMNWVTGKTPPSGSTAIIPPDRRTTWQPGVTLNTVPGQSSTGIPNRTTIFTTLSPLGGGADDTPQIQTAINNAGAAASSGNAQVVKLNAGRFLINGAFGIQMNNSWVTLRGSGTAPAGATGASLAAQTPIYSTGLNPSVITVSAGTLLVKNDMNTSINGGVLTINPNSPPFTYFDSTTLLALDAQKGSTSVTLVSNPGLSVGNLVALDMDTISHPDVIWGVGGTYGTGNFGPVGDDSHGWYVPRNGKTLCQIVKISAINGNTITFETPLHYWFQTAHSAALSVYTYPFLTGVSVENLCIAGGREHGNMSMIKCEYSWIKNVECYWGEGGGVSITGCYRCELRDSYIHDSMWPLPGGAGYLCDLTTGASDCLIENNIMIGGDKVNLMRGTGGGNVLAYNYMDDAWIWNFPVGMEAGVNAGHYTTPHMELLEGNWTANFKGDDYWGNSTYITVFRNWLIGIRTGRSYATDGNLNKPWVDPGGSGYIFADGQGRACMDIQAYSKYFNIVGNVMGFSGQTLLGPWPGYPNMGVGQGAFIYESFDSTTGLADFNNGYVYMNRIGYSQQPPDGRQWVNGEVATHLRQGNWDWYTQSQKWHGIGGSDTFGNPPNVTRPVIPPSLYLNATPAFFSNGGYRWPWVDPYTGTTYILPAKARFDNGTPNTVL